MYRSNVDMRVCVNGRPVKEYTKDGMSFIESRHGTTYSVKLKNDNGFRIMAILSVDGIDVITGKPATEATKGYIVDAYSATEIKGFRISDNDSAAFVFSSKGESYATNIVGDAKNCGVIGIRVWKEKVVEPIPQTAVCYSRTLSMPASRGTPRGIGSKGLLRSAQPASGQSPMDNMVFTSQVSSPVDAQFNTFASSFDTGTTWGNQQVDKVRKIEFDVGDKLIEFSLYYSSEVGLRTMGIDLTELPKIGDTMPQAFGSGYCTPPKNWNGK